MVDRSDIQNAPFPVLRLEVARIWGELHGETKDEIRVPLRDAEYDVDELADAIDGVTQRAPRGRRVQARHAELLAASGLRTSAASDRAARLVRAVGRRLERIDPVTSPDPLVVLEGLIAGHGLPARGAPVKHTLIAIDDLAAWFEAFPDLRIPGINQAQRASAAELRDALLREVGIEESHETGLEGSTLRAHGTRDELVGLCLRYLDMHRDLNADRADEGLPPIPGANFPEVAQWVATRRSAVAARAAERAEASVVSSET